MEKSVKMLTSLINSGQGSAGQDDGKETRISSLLPSRKDNIVKTAGKYCAPNAHVHALLLCFFCIAAISRISSSFRKSPEAVFLPPSHKLDRGPFLVFIQRYDTAPMTQLS